MNRRISTSNYLMLLIVGAGLLGTARAMTLSFLAIKLHDTFALGPAAIGVLLGAGPLVGAIAAPFAGTLSDRVGRKAIVTLALISMSVALIGMGVAGTVVVFCVSQILGAVSVAVYDPVSRALMSDVCPEPQRLTYFSRRYTASNIGWAVGPLIGIAAGAAATSLFVVAGAIYTAFAVVLFLFKLPSVTHATEAAVTNPSLLRSMSATVQDGRLALFIGGGTLLIAVYGQLSATLAPYLSQNIDGGVRMFASLMSINGFAVLIGNPFARRFVERAGALNALVVGCLFFTASQLGFMASSGFWGLAASMIMLTAGEILVVPSEYMLVDGIADDRNRGSYFGAYSLSTVGNFIGPTLGGVVLGAFGGAAMFTLFAGMAAASAMLFTIGTRTPPPKRRPDESPTRATIAGSLGDLLSVPVLARLG